MPTTIGNDLMSSLPLLFAISETVWLQVIAAVVGLVGALNGITAFLTLRFNSMAKEREEKRIADDKKDARTAEEHRVQEAARRTEDAQLAADKVESVRAELANKSQQDMMVAKETKEKLEVLAKEATLKELNDKIAADAGKIDKLALVARGTHLLVNSQMKIQLESNAKLARRLAEVTGDAEDLRRADEAEAALREHDAAQLMADDQPGSDSDKAGR